MKSLLSNHLVSSYCGNLPKIGHCVTVFSPFGHGFAFGRIQTTTPICISRSNDGGGFNTSRYVSHGISQ